MSKEFFKIEIEFAKPGIPLTEPHKKEDATSPMRELPIHVPKPLVTPEPEKTPEIIPEKTPEKVPALT